MLINDQTQPNDSYELRKTYIRTAWLVLTGYIITQIATAGAIYLGITSMQYAEIILPGTVVTAGTLIFIVIIILNKKPTKKFGDLMFFLQYPIYISMYTLWIYRLNEIRMLGLLCALIAVIFVMFFTSFLQSISISLGTTIVHIPVSYYAIAYQGQSGNFRQELFYAMCVFPAFMFLSFIARHIQKRTDDLMQAQAGMIRINQELERKNRELRAWQLIAKNEMELAAAIQQTLLPGEPSRSSGWEISIAYRPRQSVSGDFYDFYYDKDVLRGIALFDVSGHGLSSGLLMMLAKPLLFRLFNKSAKEPLHRIMDAANRELSREIEGTHSFMTGILLRFNNDSVEYVNAGHPNMLIKTGGSDGVSTLDENGSGFKGKPIGLGGLTNPFKTMKFSVHPNDILLLYSDCIIESNNSLNTPYGMQGLLDSLTAAPAGTAQEILDHIINDFKSYVRSDDLADDFTVILAKRVQ